MTDYDDLDTYNGDTEHDMWVDFDNYENTGSPDIFDKSYQQSDMYHSKRWYDKMVKITPFN